LTRPKVYDVREMMDRSPPQFFPASSGLRHISTPLKCAPTFSTSSIVAAMGVAGKDGGYPQPQKTHLCVGGHGLVHIIVRNTPNCVGDSLIFVAADVADRTSGETFGQYSDQIGNSLDFPRRLSHTLYANVLPAGPLRCLSTSPVEDGRPAYRRHRPVADFQTLGALEPPLSLGVLVKSGSHAGAPAFNCGSRTGSGRLIMTMAWSIELRNRTIGFSGLYRLDRHSRGRDFFAGSHRSGFPSCCLHG